MSDTAGTVFSSAYPGSMDANSSISSRRLATVFFSSASLSADSAVSLTAYESGDTPKTCDLE